jgi:predicted RNA methylase
MNFWPYIRYYRYMAFNWNPLLAGFLTFYEIRGDRKLGISTSGVEKLKSESEKESRFAYNIIHVATNYSILEKLIREINRYDHNKTFLDMGSGNGRTMAVAASCGFQRILGVELSKKLCDNAAKVRSVVEQKFKNVSLEIINGDAFFYSVPDSVMTFFFANPFGDNVMSAVIVKMLESYRRNPRTLRVLYIHPHCKELFLEAGFKEIYRVNRLNGFKYIEGVILQKDSS